QLFVLGAHRRGGANPLWLALDGGFCVAGLDAEHLASFGGECHAISWDSGTSDAPMGVPAVVHRMSASEASSARTVAGATSAIVTRRPSSTESDVTSASAMPQGTILSKAARSGSQLRAKPCIETPLATRTPMAQIFLSRLPLVAGSHTPDRSVTRI